MNKKKIFIYLLFVPLLLIVLIILQYILVNQFKSREIQTTKPFITSNPVNLEQIAAISYFRSCAGHDYSGFNANGEKESNRSMKHYFNPIPELRETTGTIEIYAPFNGTIDTIAPEAGFSESIFSGERGKYLLLDHPDSKWYFGIFHIDPLENFREGDSVEAGELLGYADLENAGNFDLHLQYDTDRSIFGFIVTELLGYDYPPFYRQNETLFKYMTEVVLDEYRAYEVPVEQLELSKEFRDENPCDFDKYSPDNFYTWVFEYDEEGFPIE